MPEPLETAGPAEPLRAALAAVRDLRAKVDSLEKARHEGVAIVGVGCRLPGGIKGPDDLWALLRAGVDAITEVPRSRWDNDAYYDADPQAPGRMAARHGGFLEQPDAFDPYFFGVSPREARDMDPQQRLFLEVAWEALEDAGQTRDGLRGSATGVFVGANACDFLQLQLRRPERIGQYTSAGAANSLIPNRLSYLLDLRGPSLTIDSACSSSLVAVHLAAQSLRSGECDLAVVGGMNLMLSPATTLGFAKIGALAADGRCKTFDARADGYVRSEGVVTVVLRRLSDAVAAADRIRAVVLGSAVNQDGLTNGLTAPSGSSQRDVIELALGRARLDPSQVTFLEAHGTGTALGDPIEVEALDEVYGARNRPQDACALGSIKTNLGHLEAGSGLAGLVKAALSIEHRTIPPSLHLEQLNPEISLDDSRLFVPTAVQPWTEPDERRNAAVSAFGAGGTNAHIVLGPAPAAEPRPRPEPGPVVFPISAPSAEALRRQAAAYRDFLAEPDRADLPLSDAAATAILRRTHHQHRLAVVAESPARASGLIGGWLDGREQAGIVAGRAAGWSGGGVVFAFAGHGTQRMGMGKELMQQCPAFRAAVLECDAELSRHLGHSVIGQIHLADHGELPDRLDLIQPALFALGVGLAARWRSLGVEPDTVVGHSMGEITAAHVAGALSLEDAARVVCLRARLLDTLWGSGSLLVVGLPADQADALLDGRRGLVAVAVANSPTSTVLSGDTAVLEAIAAEVASRDVFNRMLLNSVPGHGPAVDRMRDELLAGLEGIAPRPGTVPVFSTATGTLCDGAEFGPEYWYENLRRPVLFWDAVRALVDKGAEAFVEISPHPLLASSVEQAFEQARRPGLALASLRRDEPETHAVLEGIGALHTHGMSAPLTVLADRGAPNVALPGYVWQHERFPLPDPDELGVPSGIGSQTTDNDPSGLAPTVDPAPTDDPGLPQDPAQRRALVLGFLADAVAGELALDPRRLDPDTGFFQLGMDSLMAVRVRRRLEARFGLALATPVMFEHPNVTELGGHLLGLLDASAPPLPPAPPAAPASVSPPADERPMEELTESELMAILADELGTPPNIAGSAS